MNLAPKAKILIVDDNRELCENLAEILRLKGYETVEAYDGYQAIEAFRNDHFKVVLLDVKMPGLSGIETLKILKHIKPDITVIMITAFADDVLYKDELKNIEFDVIQKPLDIDKFLSKMEKLC